MQPFPAAILFVLVYLTSLPVVAAGPVQVTDDAGLDVALAHPAQRVITLAPHLTEILFAVGAGEQLVGTVRHSDFPEAAKSLPVVGDATGISFERVLGLRPDLIISWYSGIPPAVVSRLTSLGLPVYQSEPRNLAGIAQNIRELSKLVGHAEVGRDLANRYLQRLDAMRSKYRHARTVSVFYQVWDAPLMTIGSEQFLNQAITVCGGHNIFSDLQIPAPEVSFEAVLQRDPEVILYGQSTHAISDAWREPWQRFTLLAAVRNQHLYAINADLISRPGPRLLDGVAGICSALDQVRGSDG